MPAKTDKSTADSVFSVNRRTYKLTNVPVVVLCLDGCSDEYLDASLEQERMPILARMLQQGYRGKARGALPSFTNVNNASIVTGLPPSGHGISGNFFLDPESGEEVMMNSAHYLRAPTILAAAERAGRSVAMVTAKEKLLDILSNGLAGIRFSAEKANQAQMETHEIDKVEQLVGYPTPDIYSAEATLFVLRAGAALLEHNLADFLYLSTTDYMQHTYPPEAPEALDFYGEMDHAIGRLLNTGAIIGATADHGMNAKHNADGSPNVVFLEQLLREEFGEGVRVICPITDPYVKHHGALGSLVMVHLADRNISGRVEKRLLQIEAVTEVYDREQGAHLLELPEDRIGDLVVLSRRDFVLGRSPRYHDLSALDGRLRSHGGRFEEIVPILISEALTPEYAVKAENDLRNFDIFDFTINGTQR